MVRIRTRLKKQLAARMENYNLAAMVQFQREISRYSKLLTAVRRREFDYEDAGRIEQFRRVRDRLESILKTYRNVWKNK